MQLRRELGPVSAVLVTVGAIIGSGIFVIPHEVATRISSPGLTLGLWVAGGVLALLGAFTFADLGAAIPETGGMYAFLRRIYGPRVGFTYSWARFVVLIPSSVGFFAQVTARYVVAFLGAPDSWQKPFAIGVILLIAGVNVRGLRNGAGLQNVATAIKYVGLLTLAVGGLWAVSAPTAAAATLPEPDSLMIVAALVPILWAYDGWIDLTAIGGEVKDPERTIPFALTVGTALVLVVYLLANVAYLRVLGPVELALTTTPAAATAARLAGPIGATLAAALVAVSTIGGCTVALLTGSRIVYAMARDGLFFKAFASVSDRAVPHVAIMACAAMAILFVASPVGKLGDLFVIGAWPFYALGAVGALILTRREPDLARPHRAPGYPLPNLLFAAAAIVIVAGYGISNPWHTALSLGLIAVGLPLYGLFKKSGTAAPAAG
jgi:amino acid transporter